MIEAGLPVQAEVLTKHLAGASKTQIAQEMRMSRNTVTKILDESEIDRITQESKSILLSALPDSAHCIARAVRKSPQHAWELLDRTGVLPKSSGESQQINIGVMTEGLPTLHAEAKASQPAQADQSNRASDASVSERGSA